MPTFYLYWLDGKKDEVEGTNIADACRRAGIGAGALPAMDVYSDKDEFTWDEKEHTWKRST